MNILVSGLGAVGGFFGGKLLTSCHDIYFHTSKNSTQLIQKQGFFFELLNQKIQQLTPKFIHHSNFNNKIDLVICTTKTYHLKQNLEEISKYIDKNTVILSLLNGINNEQVIQKMFPENEIWNGFVFMFAERTTKNHLRETKIPSNLYYGNCKSLSKQKEFQKILEQANINGNYSENIIKLQWEKFFFISCWGTLTSYTNKTFGEILNHQKSLQLLEKLIKEFIQFADFNQVEISQNDVDLFWEKSKLTPKINRTSMALDFLNKSETELESLTGIIAKSEINLPTFQTMYEELKKRIS